MPNVVDVHQDLISKCEETALLANLLCSVLPCVELKDTVSI